MMQIRISTIVTICLENDLPQHVPKALLRRSVTSERGCNIRNRSVRIPKGSYRNLQEPMLANSL